MPLANRLPAQWCCRTISSGPGQSGLLAGDLMRPSSLLPGPRGGVADAAPATAPVAVAATASVPTPRGATMVAAASLLASRLWASPDCIARRRVALAPSPASSTAAGSALQKAHWLLELRGRMSEA